MSKGMFADPKMTLGFAGVTIVFAVVAAMSVGAFVPAIDQEPSEELVEGAQESQPAEKARPAAPAPAPQTWADEGSMADDWSPSTLTTGNGDTGWAMEGDGSGENEIEFGTYNPEPRPGRQASSPSVASNRASGGGQPSVTSRAAPNAPALTPPGGRTVGGPGGR